MDKIVVSIIAIVVLALGAPSALAQTTQTASRPVLIELFTSEGCPNCPAAERGLAFLAESQPVPQAEIVPIALHVDYWDRPEWKDPFASRLFTSRQELYVAKFKIESAFTPQFIIDGSYQVSGGDTAIATRLVQKAVQAAKATIEVSRDDRIFSVAIRAIPKQSGSTVFFAFVDESVTRVVKTRQNGERSLAHRFVVRELRAVGKVESGKDTFQADVALDPQISDSEKRSLVVFLQENQSRVILGTAKMRLE